MFHGVALLFPNIGVRGMPKPKNYRAVDMVLPIVGGCIDRGTKFVTATSLTCAHHMYFNLVYKVTSQNCGRGWCGRELSRLPKDIYASKQSVVNILPICTSGFFTMILHVQDHLVADILRFGAVSAFDASPFEEFETSIKATYRRSRKWRPTRMDRMVWSLARQQLSAPRKTGDGRKTFPPNSSNRRLLRLKGDGSHLTASTWKVSLADLSLEVSS